VAERLAPRRIDSYKSRAQWPSLKIVFREHQLGAGSASRSSKNSCGRGRAPISSVPAGNQGDQTTDVSRRRVSVRLGYDHDSSSTAPSACTTGWRSSQPNPAGRGRPIRLAGQSRGAARRRAVWPTASGSKNVYVPRAATFPDRELNAKVFGQKLDFVERMTAWSATTRLPDDPEPGGLSNIAPLRIGRVETTSNCSRVVSHTPIEVDALNRLKDFE